MHEPRAACPPAFICRYQVRPQCAGGVCRWGLSAGLVLSPMQARPSGDPAPQVPRSSGVVGPARPPHCLSSERHVTVCTHAARARPTVGASVSLGHWAWHTGGTDMTDSVTAPERPRGAASQVLQPGVCRVQLCLHTCLGDPVPCPPPCPARPLRPPARGSLSRRGAAT